MKYDDSEMNVPRNEESIGNDYLRTAENASGYAEEFYLEKALSHFNRAAHSYEQHGMPTEAKRCIEKANNIANSLY